VDGGNTVLVIEHNLDAIKSADWLVYLGPQGGYRGGRIVAEGTPEDVARVPESFTGQFLKPILARAGKLPEEAVSDPLDARVLREVGLGVSAD